MTAKLTKVSFGSIMNGVKGKAKNILRDIADTSMTTSYKIIRQEAFNTGKLYESGFVQEIENGYYLGFRASHAPYLEFGTEPHFPPIAPLLKWLQQVKMDVSDVKVSYSLYKWIVETGLAPAMARGYNPKTVTIAIKQVAKAFYICKGIELRGTEAKRFFQRGLAMGKQNAPNIVSKYKNQKVL